MNHKDTQPTGNQQGQQIMKDMNELQGMLG
jgi:hypothetical protein